MFLSSASDPTCRGRPDAVERHSPAPHRSVRSGSRGPQMRRLWSPFTLIGVIPPASPDRGQAGVVDPHALAGVQDKASARKLSAPVAQRGRRFILKVDPPEYPHVVVNEAYFIRCARPAGLPVRSRLGRRRQCRLPRRGGCRAGAGSLPGRQVPPHGRDGGERSGRPVRSAGRSNGLSRRALLALGADLGIPESAAVRVVDAVLAATAGVADDVAGGAVPLPKPWLRTWERSLYHPRRVASSCRPDRRPCASRLGGDVLHNGSAVLEGSHSGLVRRS